MGAAHAAAPSSLTLSPFASDDLADLYRSWGILHLLEESIAAMPPAWLHILNIARTILDGTPLKGVELPDEVTALCSRTEPVTYEKRRVVKRSEAARAADWIEEPEVRPIDSFAEYPRILPGHRMWQFIEPDLFYYKLLIHDVLVREREEKLAGDGEDEYEEEIVAVRKPSRRPRQRVLVLRDTSSSMRDANKGIFAKAIALAYLIKAQEEGAEVADRSFANTVHPRLKAASPAEFGVLARRILSEGYYGSTNLAAAFEITMTEIRREELGLNPYAKASTEILLISDCENPEKLPPLPPGVTVHTLHLEGGREGLMLRDYAERLQEIRDISATFVRIDTSALELPDATRDAWLLREERDALRRELDGRATGLLDDDTDLGERQQRLEELTQLYERMTRGTKAYRNVQRDLGMLYLEPRAGLRDLLLALFAKLCSLLELRADHLWPRRVPPVVQEPRPAHVAYAGRTLFRLKDD